MGVTGIILPDICYIRWLATSVTAEDHVRSIEAVMLAYQVLVMDLARRTKAEQRLQILTWAACGKLPVNMADILLDELGLRS